jgi:hypothetical protein
MTFTPLSAAAGGAILGVATIGKFLLTGRILGISGGHQRDCRELETVEITSYAFLKMIEASIAALFLRLIATAMINSSLFLCCAAVSVAAANTVLLAAAAGVHMIWAADFGGFSVMFFSKRRCLQRLVPG